MVRRHVTSLVCGTLALVLVPGGPAWAASQKKASSSASKSHATSGTTSASGSASKSASSGGAASTTGTASKPAPASTSTAGSAPTTRAATRAAAPATAAAGRVTEDRAVDILRTQVVKDGVLDMNPACVDFEREEATDRYVVIAIRERHDHRCGGDPTVRVTIDRFRVNRATGHIDYLDVLEDEWYDYAGYKEYRGQ